MLEAGRTVEEVEDFLGTGDDGKFAGSLGRGNGPLDVPSPLEGDLIERRAATATVIELGDIFLRLVRNNW